MLVALAILTACTADPPAESPPAPAPVTEPAPTKPAGSIGGEPILPKPVVVGGIENAAVEEVIGNHMASINACFEAERAKDPKLRGKVLVKFTIARDGTVSGSSTRSTSLRNETAEACVNSAVTKATFPALQGGKVAIVQYPFVFPMPI